MTSAARQGLADDHSTPEGRESAASVGRRIVEHEGRALLNLARLLDHTFVDAVQLLEACSGSVIVSGMGKAGLVGQKIAATFASTGTRSHFLHPAEAIHGDLGRIHATDLVLLLSQSGETQEVLQLLPSLAKFGVPIVSITGHPNSQLARQSTVVLWIGPVEEAGNLRLAPSTSTTAMLALGDALALATSQLRGFTPNDFARFHPGGALGRQLAKVEDVMRPLSDCRVAQHQRTVREVLVTLGRPGRRTGAVLLVDDRQRLTGIFTDSDLARLLEQQRDGLLDRPICQVMTSSPLTVSQGTMMAQAVEIITDRRISELPVTDAIGHPVGLIDITDVVAWLPRENQAADSSVEAESLSQVADVGPIILPLSNQEGGERVDET